MKHYHKILITLGILIVCLAIYLIAAYVNDQCTLKGHKTVICIPVYGQSLALGEEAILAGALFGGLPGHAAGGIP